jgi:hypothetical protein
VGTGQGLTKTGGYREGKPTWRNQITQSPLTAAVTNLTGLRILVGEILRSRSHGRRGRSSCSPYLICLASGREFPGGQVVGKFGPGRCRALKARPHDGIVNLPRTFLASRGALTAECNLAAAHRYNVATEFRHRGRPVGGSNTGRLKHGAVPESGQNFFGRRCV